MADTRIDYATKSWGVSLGCERTGTPGCDSCFAIRTAHRLSYIPSTSALYAGLTQRGPNGLDWTGVVRTVPARLADPLRWPRPERVFVASQSDLFHAAVPLEFIAQVLAVMALTPRHTYMLFTKRHARMRSVLRDDCTCHSSHAPGEHLRSLMAWAVSRANPDRIPGVPDDAEDLVRRAPWPLPNLWPIVSTEDQPRADLRIPALLETPAVVRGISVEPMLGPVDLSPWLENECGECQGSGEMSDGGGCPAGCTDGQLPRLGWVIVGGESGPGARPMDLEAAARIVEQCRAAGVPTFVKQLGSIAGGKAHHDIETFPAMLGVREYPAARGAVGIR